MSPAVDHPGAIWRGSPNFGARLAGRPWILLLHYTGMETGPAAEDWLASPASQVSSHYLIHEDGRIVQMVREADRAWHAGSSSWQGVTDVNSASIGSEIVNGGHAFGLPPFPPAQIAATIALCRDICARHRILPRHVLGHSDVAIARKVDPGERFPWTELWQAGVGHPATAGYDRGGPPLARGARGADVAELRTSLASYGYGIAAGDSYDHATEACVAAFQRHFRPARTDGVADAETRAILAGLMATLPPSA